MPSSISRKRRRKEQTAAQQLVGNEKEMVEKDVGTKGSPRLGVVQFINQVFSENKSRIHRLAAVDLLCDQMANIALEDIFSQAQLWIGHLMQTMESYKNGDSKELALCSHTLSQLLILCNGSPELRRTVSLTIVPKLLSCLLDVQSSVKGPGLIASINLMKVCIKYFGGSCLSFKNKLESYVIKVAMEVEGQKDSLVLEVCLSTLSYLPCCGGQGSTGNKHSEMWTNQLARLLQATNHLIDYLHTPCDLPSKDSAKETPPGQPFPVVEEDVGVAGLTSAARYLQVYVKAMQVMLSTPCMWKVHLPVKHLLAVVCHLTSITPDSVMFRNKARRELQVVCKVLPSLHMEAMELLSSLIHICGSCLYPYTTTLCELVTGQLQWTRAAMQEPTDVFIIARVNVFQLIADLLSQPGLSAMGSSMAPTVVEHALMELSILAPNTQADAALVAPSAKRPRTPANAITSTSCSPANERLLKLSALTVVKQLLQYLAGSLSTRHMKLMYKRLVAMTVTVQSGSVATCYSVDARIRHVLYDCLLASIHSYNLELGPLTHISVQLIRNGLTDACPLVRSLCNQGLLSCQLAMAPRSLPLVQHPSTFTAPLLDESDGELPINCSDAVTVEGSGAAALANSADVLKEVDSSNESGGEEAMEVISPPASHETSNQVTLEPLGDVGGVRRLTPPIFTLSAESNSSAAGEEQIVDSQSESFDVTADQSAVTGISTDQSAAEERSADQSAPPAQDEGKSSPIESTERSIIESANEEDPGTEVLHMIGALVTDGPDEEEK